MFILSVVFCPVAETGKHHPFLTEIHLELYLEHLQNTNKNLVYGVNNVLVSAECMVVTDFTPSDIFHKYHYSSEEIYESILIVALDDDRYLQAFNDHEMYLTCRINVVKMYSAALIF